MQVVLEVLEVALETLEVLEFVLEVVLEVLKFVLEVLEVVHLVFCKRCIPKTMDPLYELFRTGLFILFGQGTILGGPFPLSSWAPRVRI